LRRALLSILNQDPTRRNVEVLLVDDGSTDDWRDRIGDLLKDGRITVQKVSMSNVSAVRNYILMFSRRTYGMESYTARLDCDDELASGDVLARMEEAIDESRPDVLIMGNYLRLDGRIINRVNRPGPDLLDMAKLSERLERMSIDIPEAELPSCNVVVCNSVECEYPYVPSGEDHWFTVDLLLRKGELKVEIAEDLIYAIYSLSGSSTAKNRRSERYLMSRRRLYQSFVERKAVIHEKM